MTPHGLGAPAAPHRAVALTWRSFAVAITVLVAASGQPTPAVAHIAQGPCPDAMALVHPGRPRGAIPAAKAALGSNGRVLQVTRGPGSTYAAEAKRACGIEILRDSIYVVVHPIGITCSACNLHAYVVKLREGAWMVWTAY